MSDMDMITITRAQFKDAVKHCVDAFGECCPETIPKTTLSLFIFVVSGWAKGLEAVLFDSDEEDEEEENDGYMPFN